jgi:hypothetical protein
MLHHMNRAVAGNIDPNFEYVAMLLPGNGTNGGQNNTFLDSSTNNFTITRNGNTTQGTFSPYGSNWSNYFDGSGDYLTAANNTALQMSGDFTWEAWVYPISNPSVGNFKTLWAQRANASGFGGPLVVFDSSGNLVLFISNSAATSWSVSNFDTGLDVTLNSWQHIALVKSGTTVTLYKNGVAGTSTTHSTAVGTSGSTSIMSGAADGIQAVDGYMSNFRIVKGTAVYTAAFTPATAPLTAITNTSLLTCQSNRFRDNSSNNFTITRNGDVSVQRFSPFNPASPYSSSAIGGSGYFDASGDYLSVTDNATLRFGTNPFTIQAWVYIPSAGVEVSGIAGKGDSTAGTGWNFIVLTTGALRFSNGTTILDSVSTITFGAWNHVAAVRTSTATNGFQMYINGVSVFTGTVNTNFNQTNNLGIASNRNLGSSTLNGYMSSFKISNVAETITVPTSPLTSDANTTILLNFTNGSIIDNAMMNDLETVGNAQISTAQNKFGGSSILFDGTGDWLLTPYKPFVNLIPMQAWTWEAWVYPTNSASDKRLFCTGGGTAGWNSTTGIHVLIQTDQTTRVLDFQISQNTATPISINSTATVPLNQWTHVAVSVSGNTAYLAVNGTVVSGSVSGKARPSTNPTAIIGSIPGEGSSSTNYAGYMNDVRLTIGVARYTANFTPRNQPFPLR